MPIYEFVCDACGERFEELVDAGTEETACRACGTPGAKRVLSVPAATPKLVKTGAQNRRLEDKRGTDRGGAMERFKGTRKKEKAARAKRPGGSS